MKLYFKQRFFSWFDSYDIYNESQEVVYTVKGQLSWGHCLNIYDAYGEHVATLKEQLFTFFVKKFNIYVRDVYIGNIEKEFTFFVPSFFFPYKNWRIEGELFEWDYEIRDQNGILVATASKELFRFTDTYVIDVKKEEDAIYALMVVLAIDAEKCSRNNHN